MSVPQSGSQTASILASLQRPEASDTSAVVRAMRSDYQVKLAELTLSSNAKSAKVTVSADGDDPRAVKIAEALSDLWYRSLKSMLNCVAYGRVAFEKVWDFDEEAVANRVRKLEELPFDNTEMLQADGAFTGVRLKGRGGDPIDLGPDYSWWLALDPEPLNPHGTSRFKGAPYREYLSRQDVLSMQKTFVQKYIFQGGIVHGPSAIKDVNGEDVDPIPPLQTAWSSLGAGGFLYLSNERESGPNGEAGPYKWNADRLETKITSAAPLLEVISSMDSQQLLAFGIPPKTVIEGDSVGSFALVTQQMLILLSVVEDIVSQIVESFQRYVVDKVAELNGVTLTVNFMPLTEQPDNLATELVKQWLTMPQLSPLVTSGAVDVPAILEAVGVAISGDAKERIELLLSKLRTAPPVAAEAGSNAPSAQAAEDSPQPEQPQNMAVDAASTLNGAQITAAIEIVERTKIGSISKIVAKELLLGLGLESSRIDRMLGTVIVDVVSLAASPPFQLGTRS